MPDLGLRGGTTYGKTGVVAPLAFRVLLYPDGGQEVRLAG